MLEFEIELEGNQQDVIECDDCGKCHSLVVKRKGLVVGYLILCSKQYPEVKSRMRWDDANK